jgi:hypothetical protein
LFEELELIPYNTLSYGMIRQGPPKHSFYFTAMTLIYLFGNCEICGKEIARIKSAMIRSLKRSARLTCADCRAVSHNQSKTTEYKSWQSMKGRCDNPNITNYARYGGRGITYQETWKNFKNFIEDMGKMPSSSMELDRIDNDGNYCKENCRWATRKEQTRNRGGKRATRLYTFNGKTMCIADWAKEIGITAASLQKRLNKNWPLEIALSPEKHDGGDRSKHVTPAENPTKGKTVRNKNAQFITIDDVTKTYTEWELEKGLSKGLISKRLQRGCTPYEAVMNPVRK